MTNIILVLGLIERGVVAADKAGKIITAIKESRDLTDTELIDMQNLNDEALYRLEDQKFDNG